MASRKCCVRSCDSTSKTHRLFNIPKNDKLRELWLYFLIPTNTELSGLSKEQLVSKRVCQNHFDRHQFDGTGNRLAHGYPSLFTPKEVMYGVALSSSVGDHLSDHNYFLQSELEVSEEAEATVLTEAQHATITTIENPLDDDHTTDDLVEDDHVTIAPDQPSEPVPPPFSWQNTSLISLEPQTESENLDGKVESEPIRNVNNENISIKDKTSETEYCCDGCQKTITGYTCVQCDDFDLCGACEAAMLHPQHYMLRVPGPRPQRQVKSIIEAIRRKLKILEAELGSDEFARMDWEVEIKKEEDPLEEPAVLETDSKDTNLDDTTEHYEVPDVSNQIDIIDEEQIEENIHVYGSESEQTDNSKTVANDENQKESDEQHDFESQEWLDESLLDEDDVDNACNRSELQTLHHVKDLEKNVRSYSRKKETIIPLISGLKSKEGVIDSSILSITNTKQNYTKESNVLKSSANRKYMLDNVDKQETPQVVDDIDLEKIVRSYSRKKEVKELPPKLKHKPTILASKSKEGVRDSSMLSIPSMKQNVNPKYETKESTVLHISAKTVHVLSENDRLRNLHSIRVDTGTQVSQNDIEIPVHPAKRKTSVCDKEIIPDVRQSPGLLKQTATSKTVGFTTKASTDSSMASKRLKLSDLDIRQIKELKVVPTLNNPQTAVPMDIVNSKKRLVVKLDDVAKMIYHSKN